jgi:flagellar export protein FliJ
MAVSRALRRLLRIREVEEEQRRLALEAALSELSRMEQALAATNRRESRGRRMVAVSARTNEAADRLAGLEQARTAARHADHLAGRIESAAEQVAALREELLLRRVERRQAETLIDEAAAREAIVAARRGQQALDDWFAARRFRQEGAAEGSGPESQAGSAEREES